MTLDRRRGFLVVCAVFLSFPVLSRAQGQTGGTKAKRSGSVLKVDGEAPYFKAWIEQDVVWIITDEERAAFKLLKNDEERDNFIEAFWDRRNPTPDSFDNPFKDEHYRRTVYANEHFGAAIPGWKSDRGQIYILFGGPAGVHSYPSGRMQGETSEGGDALSLPLEVWHYRYIEGLGQDIDLEFVDACRCSEFKMRITPAMEKYEPHFDPEGPGIRSRGGLLNPPKIKFKDLEEKSTVDLHWKTLPFEVSTDTVKATDATSLVPITISFQKSDLTFVEKDGSRRAGVNIFGRVTTLTGRVAEIFEDALEIDASSESEASSKDATSFAKALVLRNGRYRVEIAAQEVNSDHWGRWVRGVKVGDW